MMHGDRHACAIAADWISWSGPLPVGVPYGKQPRDRLIRAAV
jgi:hypothetical protein